MAKPPSAGAHAARVTGVPAANPKAPGLVAPNILSPELDLRLVATGAYALDGGNDDTKYYGYESTNVNAAMVPVLGSTSPTIPPPIAEATKTEPDKNTYLVFDPTRGAQKQLGADPNYDYGTHFVFQGHEAGDHGYGNSE